MQLFQLKSANWTPSIFASLMFLCLGLGSFGSNCSLGCTAEPTLDPPKVSKGWELLAEEVGISEEDAWEPVQQTRRESGQSENQQQNSTETGQRQSEQIDPVKQTKKQELSPQQKRLLQIPKTDDPKVLLAFGKKVEEYRSRSTAFSVARARTLRELGKKLEAVSSAQNREAYFFGRFLTLKYDSREVTRSTLVRAAKYLEQKGKIENADTNLCVCLLMRSKGESLQAFAAKNFAKQFRTVKKHQSPKKVDYLARRFEGLVRFHNLVGNEFQLNGEDTNGKEFHLSDLKGKVVLVHFWSMKCNVSQKELETLKRNYKDYHPQGLEIVSVSVDRNPAGIYQHLQRHNIQWTNLVSAGERNPAIGFYGIVGAPTYILVGKDGKVIGTTKCLKKMVPELETLFPSKSR